jgi:hypothetical protein
MHAVPLPNVVILPASEIVHSYTSFVPFVGYSMVTEHPPINSECSGALDLFFTVARECATWTLLTRRGKELELRLPPLDDHGSYDQRPICAVGNGDDPSRPKFRSNDLEVDRIQCPVATSHTIWSSHQ